MQNQKKRIYRHDHNCLTGKLGVYLKFKNCFRFFTERQDRRGKVLLLMALYLYGNMHNMVAELFLEEQINFILLLSISEKKFNVYLTSTTEVNTIEVK